jgi:hypothetical protein
MLAHRGQLPVHVILHPLHLLVVIQKVLVGFLPIGHHLLHLRVLHVLHPCLSFLIIAQVLEALSECLLGIEICLRLRPLIARQPIDLGLQSRR